MFWHDKDKKPGWFGKQLEENIKALRDGDRSRIPWIFCIFAENHEKSKVIAAKALRETLDNLSFEELVRTDEQMRQTTSMEWSINWRELNINDFFTSQMEEQDKRALAVFASFNPSGFIRERAVKLMQDYDGTLPYILLRQNDWVLQVRQAANAAFEHRLQRLSGGEILAALPFAEKLKLSSRGSHGEYTRRFFEALTAPEQLTDLMKGLESSNVRTRRICVNALFGVDPPKTKVAFERLTCDPDPFLRATLFRKLNDLGENLNEAVEAFLKDKYPMNRKLAFQYLLAANTNNINTSSVKMNGANMNDINTDDIKINDTNMNNIVRNDIYDVAKTLLLDRSAIVREAAQNFIQTQAPGFDFRGFYFENLERDTAAAICGLGEKGQPDDAFVLLKYLDDVRIFVVKSTMVSLMRMDDEKYSHRITEMLNDARAGVVKTARNLIMKTGLPDYEKVKEILTVTAYKHSKLKCLDILFAAPKWPGIIYMLEAVSDEDEDIKEKSLAAIDRWLFRFNRSFALPDDMQTEKIKIIIHELNAKLPPNIQKELLFALPS